MADWIIITAPDYFTPEFSAIVYNNMQYIAQEAGMTVTISEPSFSRGMDIRNILTGFNTIESDIQEIHNLITDWYDMYYREYTWTVNTVCKYPEVKRWVNWLNYIKSVLDGTSPQLQFLTDSSNNLITDSSGHYILVRSV